jgi:hypothetical protein
MNLRAFPCSGSRGLAVLGLIGLLASPGYSDNSAALVDGVEVLVENVINGQTAATKTEESGRFMLTGLAPGEYRLIIGIVRQPAPVSSDESEIAPAQPVGYDVRISVYGGAMTAQWVPASSPKMRVGIVFAVPSRANGTIAGTITPAAPPAVQTRITWPIPPSFGN